jgi:hypothetical protein
MLAHESLGGHAMAVDQFEPVEVVVQRAMNNGHRGIGGFGYCVECGARAGSYRALNNCQGGW